MDVFNFTDAIQPGPPIKVLARISLLPTAEGGKSLPFTHSYRPNHNFGEPDATQFYVGQIEVPEGTWIHPGEAHEVMVTFLNGPGLDELLQVGKTWRIQEGNKLVARGEILGRLGEA